MTLQLGSSTKLETGRSNDNSSSTTSLKKNRVLHSKTSLLDAEEIKRGGGPPLDSTNIEALFASMSGPSDSSSNDAGSGSRAEEPNVRSYWRQEEPPPRGGRPSPTTRDDGSMLLNPSSAFSMIPHHPQAQPPVALFHGASSIRMPSSVLGTASSALLPTPAGAAGGSSLDPFWNLLEFLPGHQTQSSINRQILHQQQAAMAERQQVQQLVTSIVLSGLVPNNLENALPSSNRQQPPPTTILSASQTNREVAAASPSTTNFLPPTREQIQAQNSRRTLPPADTPYGRAPAATSRRSPCRARGMPPEHDFQASLFKGLQPVAAHSCTTF